MKTTIRFFPFSLAILIVSFATTSAIAESVVVFGDSWGVPFEPALQQVLDDNGLGGVSVVNAAFGGETAAQMNSSSLSSGLPYISNVLNANPDAELVHLSIGGNDILSYLGQGILPGSSVLSSIENDIATIVNHILSIRPDIQVYYPTYDYLPASAYNGSSLTPSNVNALFDTWAGNSQALANSIPRMTFNNSLGLMQQNYGLPGLGIPPFDPSLPDPNSPSPEIAFADPIHLTTEGYAIFAQEAFSVFYGPQLVPEPSALLLGALTSLGLLTRRRKRLQAGSFVDRRVTKALLGLSPGPPARG